MSTRASLKLFGSRNPLGLHIGFGDPETAKLDIEISASSRIKERNLKTKVEPEVWIPVLQDEKPSSLTFYLRTDINTEVTAATVRQAIRKADERLPIYNLKTSKTQIKETHYIDRLLSMLSAAFGL